MKTRKTYYIWSVTVTIFICKYYFIDLYLSGINIERTFFIYICQVSILKEHFSSFGEVTSLEVDKKGTENEKETEARVTYTTHEAAEKAYCCGMSLRGHSLTFKWVPPNNKMNESTAGAVPHENLKPVTAALSNPTHPVQTEVENSPSPSGGPMESAERKDNTADFQDGGTDDKMGDADAANLGTVSCIEVESHFVL
jgi:RNA recognition motif. (a.k.a. RRM, RBD, or RNP domain)